MNTISATPNLIATFESYLCSSHSTSPPSVDTSSSSSSSFSSLPALHLLPAPTLGKLHNVGPARIRDMRLLVGHARQILSHMPISSASPQTCMRCNDALYAALRLHSDKFSGLALLPGGEGEGRDAARELQRCVVKYGFVGGVVGVKRGGSLEAQRLVGFEGLWDMAVRCGVSVALREVWPVVGEIPDYQRNLPDSVLAPLLTHISTSHTTSPLPFLQLYLSGIFDRFPTLRLVLCHPGALPSLVPRIETLLAAIPTANKPQRSYLDVWQHNIYLTTMDVQDMASMRALLEQIPMDRVLYASNYPLEERGNGLMLELRDGGFLTREEWERLAWKNAEVLFGRKGWSPLGG